MGGAELLPLRPAQRHDAMRCAPSCGRATSTTDVHWPEPPHLQPAFAHLGYGRGSLPVTESLCDEVLTLPMFPEMSEAEVDRVCGVLRDFANRKATVRTGGA